MPKNRHLQNIVGTEHITDAAEQAIAAQAEGGATLAFKNIAVSGQSNIVADAATDTLNIAAGANVTITTNASTDTITIAATDTNTDTNTFRPVTAGGNTLGASETLAFTAGSNVTISESAGAVTIAATGGSPGGSDGQIQYNNGGSFGGSSLVYTDTADAEQFKIDVSSSETPFVIVQTGAGNSFEVHDAADPDNNRFQISNSGNVTIKGLNGGGFGEALYVAGNTIANRFKVEQGTASNNSFSHAQDTNTGLHFPAADNLAIATGGTERLRVGSSGQIGIAGANYGTSGQVLTSGGASGAVSWTTVSGGGGGAISSMADLQPKPQSSNLQSVGGAGNYQKTLGGAPFFLNLGSWSTIQTGDMSSGDNGQVVFFPYMGSGETMVKARAYKVNSTGMNNDMKLMLAFYASDSDGIPTGGPVNSGSVELISLVSGSAAVLEATWTNGPTLTSGELFYLGVTIDTNAYTASANGDRNLGSIRATPTFEQEALGFSFSTLLLNNSQFGRVTGLVSSTSTGTTNGSRAFPTIGSGSVSLATTSGKNVPRVSFEVTYS